MFHKRRDRKTKPWLPRPCWPLGRPLWYTRRRDTAEFGPQGSKNARTAYQVGVGICSAFLAAGLVAFRLAGSLLGCSKSGEADEVAVGAFLSLSGKESTFGIDTREGIDMATEDINAAGGIKGKKVRVIFEDDKSNAQEASNKVLQLIDRDKAIAILGEVASSRSKAGGLVANNKHIPMVTPSSTNVDVTQGREYVFRACFTDDQQGRSAASFAVEKLGKKKLAILYVAQDSYSSGSRLRSATRRKSWARRSSPTRATNRGKRISRPTSMRSRRANPELIFAPNYYSDMVPIARQAKDVGLPGALFLGGDGWDSEDLLKGPPPSSRGPI